MRRLSVPGPNVQPGDLLVTGHPEQELRRSVTQVMSCGRGTRLACIDGTHPVVPFGQTATVERAA